MKKNRCKRKTEFKIAKMRILTGKKGHRMNDHMMKKKNGREIWKCNRTLLNKNEQSTLNQWARSLQVVSTKKLGSVRQEISLDVISNLKTTMINSMTLCRSRK